MLSHAHFLAATLLFSGAPTNPSSGDTTAATFSQDQIIEAWGWSIAQEKQLNGTELTPAELALFLQGFAGGATNQPAPSQLQQTYFDVQQLAKARREKAVQAINQKNELAASAYLAQVKTNSGVIGLPGNVWGEILRPGGETHPKLEQTVNVHYTACLMDGTEFSQMGPVDMVLVTNRDVCRGWSGALQQIGPGGVLKLYVPPPLSAADAAVFGIQPGSLMIFEVELLAVTNTAPDDLAAALTPPAPEPPPPPRSGLPDSQIIQTWGWITAHESHADRFSLTTEEISHLLLGLSAGVAGQPPSGGYAQLHPLVQEFVADQQARAAANASEQQRSEREALFARLRQNTNVVELPDGLRYEILQPGTGPFPRPTQQVIVRYTGRLLNGTVFDSTAIGPLAIDLDKVMPGWSEGVQKINPGGKIKLYIPPALGYGGVATSGIPPNSTLIYEIELLQIKDGEPEGSPSVPH